MLRDEAQVEVGLFTNPKFGNSREGLSHPPERNGQVFKLNLPAQVLNQQRDSSADKYLN